MVNTIFWLQIRNMWLSTVALSLIIVFPSISGFVLPGPDSLEYYYLAVSQEVFIFPGPKKPDNRAKTQSQRAEAVKDAFKFAWEGYFSKWKGHDELLPVSKSNMYFSFNVKPCETFLRLSFA